jgi:nitrite reductase/ring-hydroxylating ferredoxin subunit
LPAVRNLLSLAGRILAGNVLAFVKVAKESRVTEYVLSAFEAGHRKLVIVKEAGKLYAFEDCCTHLGGRLSLGCLNGTIVTCPLHGARYDIETGALLSGPGRGPVRTFPVKVEGDDILVDL